ncbi:hypothetical protein N7478_001844 [Penicillium angulare]|uniref:uncharacterized protein n=1 Tax=Penicillium angulare TaxID=116970 RepID=UPI002540E664|nr:uncharacterized protein N7478_001844 [Penicillium angulare]KAJ5288814.1 hypothetical protein N7478_001844 [Penicillium angulare]
MHAQWSVKKDVRQRIYEICTGHLQWVSRLDTRAASSSNIWIDGRDADLSDEGGLIDLPHDSPISMPSHIIKATEYLKVFPDTSDLAFVCRWLYGFALKWFDQLIETKNHITPTWQHSRGSDIPKYRLSDQIWIWKALKSLEDLVIRVEQVQKTTSNEMLEKFLQIKENLYSRGPGASKPSTKLEFNSDGLRNENIRRFTLYNDVARSHMLSVTRSARETRFLLHDKDTVLYYGLEWGFFDKSEKYWTRLVHNQTEHDKDCNDEAQWNSPLRYGLAIEMAKHNHQFDSDFPASEMAVHSKQIVVNSSSETGLFPGNLNNEKEPAIFEHEAYRDFYFHSGFEIPYILVRCEKKGMNLRIMSVENAIGDSEERPPAPSPVPIRPLARSPTMAREPRSSSRPRDISPFQGAIIDGQLRDDPDFPTKFLAFGTSRTLKRQNPYGRLIDLSNIVEIPEEWLYKYPEFLDYVPPTNEKEILRIKTESSPSIRDEKLFGLLIARRPVVGECYVRVDDIRKGQKHQKWSNEKKITTVIHKEYRGLWNQLQKGRSAEKTKKRLIYLRSIDYTVAAICYVSSTERERSDIAQFFDRHAKVDTSYLYDDTAVVFNSWITEVHFRFHKLKDTKMAPQPDSRVRRLRSQGCKYLQHDAHIVDEVIGFRIVGDFFDRYWTCHVVHTCSKTESSILDESHQKEKHWQQRKVLELILFNSILANVWNSIDVILGKLELQSGIFSSDSFEDRRPDELLKCFQLLVILKNNIIGLQALIEQWDRRESVRGRGRPRWTRSDEEKYRKSIDKQLADFEGHIRDIKAMTARIEFLITLVTNAQETIRSKKSLTEAENITLFTYVTAFFLPTGLAASVFSMNGVPSSTVIASMVITAAVALLITAGILWCLLSQYVRSRARDFLGLFQSGDKLINSRE